MSSTIFYRFRSQKNTSRILFDGTGITVFDLKKEIINDNKLGDGTGFDLRLYNNDTNEEYTDDTLVIPRSTSVIVRRSPPSRPGKGTGARYVTGKPRITKVTLNNNTTNGGQQGITGGGSADLGGVSGSTAVDSQLSEQDRIKMMFMNQSDQWREAQQTMANATPVFNKPQPSAATTGNNPDDVPPPGYMCYRCGSKDHWIKNCPTNNDPNWEGKRIKRTTGIPKTYLKTVEKPEDDSSKTYLMNEEGQYVVQVADSKTWGEYQKRANKTNELDLLKDVDVELLDPITGKVMKDPVTTPCCGKNYSRDTIEDILLEKDLVCPNCSKPDLYLDTLKPNDDLKQKIDELLEQEREKRGIKRTTGVESGGDAKRPNLTGPQMPIPMMPPFGFPFVIPPTNQVQPQQSNE